jgi:hypothetical protein
VAINDLLSSLLSAESLFMPDPIALRVARRHAREAAVVFRDVSAKPFRIEYSNSGRILAIELSKMLEPVVGPLARMVFHRPPGSTNTIGWAVVDPAGDVVSGMLVMHAEVGEHEVTSWAEVTIDPADANMIVDPADLRLLRSAPTTSAERVAREYMRRGEGLVPVDGEEDERVADEAVDNEGEQR